MIRIVIENLLLFLLPTLIYLTYMYVRRQMSSAEAPAPPVDDAPLLWLFGAGAVLVVVTLLLFGSTSGGRPGEAYAPPKMEDGRIVPGHVDRQERAGKSPPSKPTP